MTPTSLDNQSGAADDTHIVRIVRLETQMDNVTSILASLQRQQTEQHQAIMVRLDDLRDKMDQTQWHLLSRMDRQLYWMTGLILASTSAAVGVLIRLGGT